MRYSLVLLGLAFLSSVSTAQQDQGFPDPSGEISPMDKGFWMNMGQLADENGNATMQAAFISEGVYPMTYPSDHGRISFVAAVESGDTLVPDTLLRWDMQLLGEQAQSVDPLGVSPYSDHRNYYLPHCGEEGVTFVRRYERVVYEEVYAGIDLHVYAGATGQKMAFVCRPGSDPSAIAMLFEGMQGAMVVDDDGHLIFHVLGQDIRVPSVFAYQFNDEGITDVEQEGFKYGLVNETVSFELGEYDHDQPLVLFMGDSEPAELMGGGQGIDGLCWSTYFGGQRFEDINGSCMDINQYYYVSGQTGSSSATFPSTPFSPTPYSLALLYNAFVSKFDPDHILKWTTLFGGGGTSMTQCYSVTTKMDAGVAHVYVGGYTDSGTFPVWPSGIAYYDGAGVAGTQQGFIFKTDQDGLRTWCTYFGNQLTWVTGMDMYAGQRLVFTGISTQLPATQVTAPVGSTNYSFSGGAYDGYIAMLSSTDQLIWRTFYGGSNADLPRSIAMQSGSKTYYVMGTTGSSNIQLVNKVGAYNGNYSGGSDQFLVRVVGTTINWTTYFGGNGNEEASWDGLAIDPVDNNVFIVGGTSSSAGFPLVSYTGGYFNGTYTADQRGHIARFSGTTQALQWSTFFGSGLGQVATSVAVSKSDGSVYVAGYNLNGTIPLLYAGVGRYYQPTHNLNLAIGNEYQDAFVSAFGRILPSLKWSTYFGGNSLYIESVSTLECPPLANVIATGRHFKGYDTSTYFPLSPPYDPLAFYDPIWNDPPTATGQDAFITLFCGGPKSMPVQEQAPVGGLMALGDGYYRFADVDTTGPLQVYDAAGHLVQTMLVRATDGVSEPFLLNGLTAGLYVLDLSGTRAKLVITP